MAEDTDSSSGAKKRRVIHWNPDAGREQNVRRWTWKKIVLATVGGFFGLLVAAGLVIRGARLIFGPDTFRPGSAVVAQSGEPSDPNSAFITQNKAEQLHEQSSKQLAELRRMPPDHPVQLQNMILIEKTYIEGEQALQGHEYAKAYSIFEGLRKDMTAFSENVKAKTQARQAYDVIMLRVKDLEIARALAPGTLEAAVDGAANGRAMLNDGNFTGAKKVFDEAQAQLKKAEVALADFVRENLLNGQKALTKGDKEGAKKAFSAALEKAPGNDVAMNGMKRAENIDRVFALLQQGEKLEKSAQYAAAAESYQKAFALDAQSAEAQQGQARAERLEKETKFAAAQAAANDAFKRREWNKVITEVENALKIYPKKPEMTALLKSAKENAHQDAVKNSLAKAYAYENNHQWNESRVAYEETMKLEPENADAKDGYLRSGTVIRALMQYDKLIDAAEQLANKAEFVAARNRFNDAMNSKPSYLQPTDRVLQLQALIRLQSQPVEVTFKSDGKTYVSIVGFKSPAPFESQTFKIMPGDYTVKGSRRGYKDVNMMLQVRNGQTPPVVTVSCNESTRG